MRGLVLCLTLTSLACDDGYADVSGEYTLALTNGSNGCMFDNWTEGETASGVPLSVTQTEDHVTGEVGGLGGAYLEAVLGSRIFTGSVSGNDISMRLVGTTMAMQGTCDYSVDSIAEARLSGDALNGTLTYTAVTDGANDCGSLTGCETIQSFSGARPPPPQ